MVVSNAGVPTIFGAAHSMDLDRWRRDLDVNLTGSFRVLQACLPGMRERGYGRVVVISSIAARARDAGPDRLQRQQGRAAGDGQDDRRRERRSRHHRQRHPPGAGGQLGVLGMPKEILDTWRERIPTGRLVGTEEIAEAVAFFASPNAGSVTGQDLLIDGGQTLNTMSVTGSVVRQRRSDP